MKKPTFPITLKRGSAVVKIYATPSKGYESYTLSYYSDGVRKRPTFAALDEARLEADTVLNRLTKGDLDTVTLTRAECAAFARARELLDPIGVALENAAAQFADATRRLGAVPVSRAVDFYLQRHPTEIKARPVQEVIEELIAAKRQDNLSKRYLAQLGYDLARFATKFSGPIASVRGVEIDGWLRGLGWAPRTRNNMRIS
jgi:hypothetical protein